MRFRRLGTISAVLIAAAILFTQVLVAPAGAADATASGPPFTIVAVPDTQFYTTSDTAAATFAAQTQWIVDNMAAKNIAFVTHLGDITENGNRIGYEAEWPRADAAMDTLDTVNLPYGLVAGNHDVLPIPPAASTMYEMYFGADRFTGDPWYGGHYGSTNLNSYQLFSAGGMDLIVLNLEFSPTQSIVDWANGILRSHQDRWAIVVTHYYLSQQSSGPGIRFTNNLWYGGKTPEQLWNELIYPNCNVVMVLSGHDPGEDGREDLNACGGQVHQLLQDYQGRPNGGNGWLRYFEFDPAQNQIRAFTYSPTLGQFEIDADSQFILPARRRISSAPSASLPPSLQHDLQRKRRRHQRHRPTLDLHDLYALFPIGQQTLTLDWTGSADLRIDVRVASTNAWVGANTSTTKPKSLTVNLSAGTAYKVGVWSMSGSAAFTVTLGVGDPGRSGPDRRSDRPGGGGHGGRIGDDHGFGQRRRGGGVGGVQGRRDRGGHRHRWRKRVVRGVGRGHGARRHPRPGGDRHRHVGSDRRGPRPHRDGGQLQPGGRVLLDRRRLPAALLPAGRRRRSPPPRPDRTPSCWTGAARRISASTCAWPPPTSWSRPVNRPPTPKSLTVNLTAGTAYQIAVWSMSGAASFTVTATSPG